MEGTQTYYYTYVPQCHYAMQNHALELGKLLKDVMSSMQN